MGVCSSPQTLGQALDLRIPTHAVADATPLRPFLVPCSRLEARLGIEQTRS
jgi:hypothetical protein